MRGQQYNVTNRTYFRHLIVLVYTFILFCYAGTLCYSISAGNPIVQNSLYVKQATFICHSRQMRAVAWQRCQLCGNTLSCAATQSVAWQRTQLCGNAVSCAATQSVAWQRTQLCGNVVSCAATQSVVRQRTQLCSNAVSCAATQSVEWQRSQLCGIAVSCVTILSVDLFFCLRLYLLTYFVTSLSFSIELERSSDV